MRRNLNGVSRAYEILKGVSVTARYDPHAELAGLGVKRAKELRQCIMGAIA